MVKCYEQGDDMQNDKIVKVGWFASLMAVLMFASFLDQIRLNLAGNPGSLLLPVATVINCSTWIVYGALKRPVRDWPVVTCNIIGVFVGMTTVMTAL